MVWNWYQDWQFRRSALRELQEIKRQDDERLAGSEASPLNQAMRALHAGDKVVAAQFWQQACEQMPSHLVQSGEAIELLLGLERFDELATLMQRARKASPLGSHHLVGLAKMYQRQGKLEDAERWWAALRKHSPADPQGYLAGADCLCGLGRVGKAAAVMKTGVRVLPDNAEIWSKFAHVSEQVSDWQSALTSWDHVAAEFGWSSGAVGAARVLEKLGDRVAALQRLEAARTRYAYDRDVLVALARLLEQLRSVDEALVCWQEIRQAFPRWKTGYEESARCLAKVGKDDEAAAVWRAWEVRFPESAAA